MHVVCFAEDDDGRLLSTERTVECGDFGAGGKVSPLPFSNPRLYPH